MREKERGASVVLYLSCFACASMFPSHAAASRTASLYNAFYINIKKYIYIYTQTHTHSAVRE